MHVNEINAVKFSSNKTQTLLLWEFFFIIIIVGNKSLSLFMSRGRVRRDIKPNCIQMFNVDKIKIYILFKEAYSNTFNFDYWE